VLGMFEDELSAELPKSGQRLTLVR